MFSKKKLKLAFLLREIIFTDYTVLNKVEDYIQPLVFKEFQKIVKSYSDKIILKFEEVYFYVIFVFPVL